VEGTGENISNKGGNGHRRGIRTAAKKTIATGGTTLTPQERDEAIGALSRK
jgi:hypothetical protein